MRTHKISRLKKLTAVALAALMAGVLALTGCAAPAANQSSASSSASASSSGAAEADAKAAMAEADALRIGSLKGPTSIGLASMMMEGQGIFTVAATADEIAPKLLQDELDIVLVPANLAATLYQKTDGNVRVLDVNTLGVLYAVTMASDVTSVADLRGRTVYMTGKGTVPEYTVRALLEASDVALSEVDIQFRSEPAEVAALIAQDNEAVGILPQPYVTAATLQNDALKSVIDLTSAWEEATGGTRGSLITGVTIAKASTVENKAAGIAEFVRRHAASTNVANDDPATIADEVVELGIVGNAQIAQKAIPACNVVCLTNQYLINALSGYLETLYEQDPASIGGALPGPDFYYYEKPGA